MHGTDSLHCPCVIINQKIKRFFFLNSVDDCDFKIAKLVADGYYIVVLLVIYEQVHRQLQI